MENPTEPLRFNKYLVIDKIAEGGFGSIYRAIHGEKFAQRIVIIKTIKKKYSRDEVFKKAFLNEIKNTFPLTHANIAQIYDYGIDNDRLYYALEYVQGVNLKQLFKKSIIEKQRLTLPQIIYIISESAKGLYFAHKFKDTLTSRSKKLIHRDISPQNIMIGFNGTIKIIDFGIAKAKANIDDNTRTGIVKGKPAYMSPEYVRGEKYDRRLDQFSLGVVFWELATGKRLFAAKSSIETMKKIDKCEIPLPRFYNDNIDFELQEIILQTLKEDQFKRFRHLEELFHKLDRILYTKYDDFSPNIFSSFISNLFKKEIKLANEKTKRLITASYVKNAIDRMPK